MGVICVQGEVGHGWVSGLCWEWERNWDEWDCERAKSQKKEHSKTNVCLPMTLHEMLGYSLLNDVAYFKP